MALTQVNVDNYLNIAKALQTVEQRPCWMMFDAEADVLYHGTGTKLGVRG
jgi:hypothetical protein